MELRLCCLNVPKDPCFSRFYSICSSVLVCPVKEGEFIASHLSNEKTHLTKFTVNQNIDKNRQYFDPICDQLTSLNKVKDIEEAVIGLSNTGQLYIW